MIWKLLLLLLLSGCSVLDRTPVAAPIEVVTVVEKAPQYHPPLPNPISTTPVEWTVLTPDTMSEYLADLENGDAPTNAYYGLTPKSYENLSNNMADVKRYIRQLLSILSYYQEPVEK